jgi:hypothetical protein
MSATTTDRNTPRKATNLLHILIAAATAIPAGVMVAVNASGYGVNAADAANLVVVGRAEEAAANSAGAAGDVSIDVLQGIFLWENDTVAPVTLARVGRPCYVLDNQTVSAAAGTNSIIAGIVTEVSAAGVWVETGVLAKAGATGATGATGPTGPTGG